MPRWEDIRTFPIAKRKNIISLALFGKVPRKGSSLKSFLQGLPRILAANQFRELVSAIHTAKKKKKPVIIGLGAHTIKCGVTPYLITLLEHGFVTGISMNGAASIHDFEIAMIGETSENVAEGLKDGSFGLVEETGRQMNEGINQFGQEGLGQALGHTISELKLRHRTSSLLYYCYARDIPVTVHTAIGTEMIHMHPTMDGAATGQATFIDFQKLTGLICGIGDGGVYMNIGSAVILPEIFVKALTIARNLGNRAKNFTTANIDMIQHYRPNQNVVSRPVLQGGRGISITGHHEMMIPLLAQALLDGVWKS